MNSRTLRHRQFGLESLESRTVLNGSAVAQDYAALVHDIGTLNNDLKSTITSPAAFATLITADLARVQGDVNTLIAAVPAGQDQALVSQLRNDVLGYTYAVNQLVIDLAHNAAPSTIAADQNAVQTATQNLTNDTHTLAQDVDDEGDESDDNGDDRNGQGDQNNDGGDSGHNNDKGNKHGKGKKD